MFDTLKACQLLPKVGVRRWSAAAIPSPTSSVSEHSTCADFCGHVLAQFPDSKGGVEQVLGLGDSERGVDGDLFTDTDCGIDVCSFGGEVSDESDFECPVSIERFCRVEHFGSVGETDQPRQPPGSAEVAAGETAAGEHRAEARGGVRDADVGHCRQSQPGADGVAVDGGDDRLRDLTQRQGHVGGAFEGQVSSLDLAMPWNVESGDEIHTGAERTPGAGEHDDAAGVVPT
jgi:hypothetical protein